jgi:hypothetical protein
VVVGRLIAAHPELRALARVVNRRELASQCQDALINVDIRSSGWDIHAHWWGVVVCRTSPGEN